MNLLTPGQLASLAQAAIAAPSADNRHVFRLEVEGDSLRVLATPEFLAASTSRCVLGLVSIGAVLENLTLRAARLGLSLEARPFDRQGNEALLAEFTVGEGAVRSDALESAIEARHSNRRLRFSGPRLAAEAQQQLVAQALVVPGTDLLWLDGPADRRRALSLVRIAETERFRNRALHRELFESIRFDVGWRSSAPEGLPPATLELSRFERPGFALLRHWHVQRIANLFGAHHVIGFRGADLPCRLAPHLCAIVAEGETSVAAVAAGRLLQRVWLQATTFGLSLQVFAAAPLFALDGATSIAPRLQKRLADRWKTLCPRGQPFVVIRMGAAKPPSQRSGRPPSEFARRA